MISKSLSQCKANISNMKTILLKISYIDGVLSMSYQEEGKEAYKCFSINVDLPQPGYFGISAGSGNTPVQYDVYSFLTNSFRKQDLMNEQENNDNIEYEEQKEEIIEEEIEEQIIEDKQDILDQIANYFDENKKKVNKNNKEYTKKDLKDLSEKIKQIEETLNEYIHNVELKQQKLQETLKTILSKKEKKDDERSQESMVEKIKSEIESTKNSINSGLASKLSQVEKDIAYMRSMITISSRKIDTIKKESNELESVIDRIETMENQTVSGIIYFVIFEVGFILAVIIWRNLINSSKDKLY